MAESVKWWMRRCYICQARKNARHTVRWPLVSLPLPNGPGQMIAFDLLGDLPKTDRGNRYILLVVDLFSRHAEAYAITSAEKTAKGCASRLVNDYIPRWGCPQTFLSDRGAEFVSQVAREVYEMLVTPTDKWHGGKVKSHATPNVVTFDSGRSEKLGRVVVACSCCAQQ